MTTTAQALADLAYIDIQTRYLSSIPPIKFERIRQHIESTASEIARLQAECEALRKDADSWRRLAEDALLAAEVGLDLPKIRKRMGLPKADSVSEE